MGWETRGPNGRSYYYRKTRRPDGSVQSTYVGDGPLAVVVAEQDALVRAIRDWTWAAECIVLGDVDDADEAVRATTAAVKEQLWAALEAKGLRYHRGEWRRPRAASAVETPTEEAPSPCLEPTLDLSPDTVLDEDEGSRSGTNDEPTPDR